jgi:hypothetical protein
LLATPPADCLRGLLVGRSLVEFALRYCQVLIELAKPRQIAGGQLHPRRGMTAGPEEEIALLMRTIRSCGACRIWNWPPATFAVAATSK